MLLFNSLRKYLALFYLAAIYASAVFAAANDVSLPYCSSDDESRETTADKILYLE